MTVEVEFENELGLLYWVLLENHALDPSDGEGYTCQRGECKESMRWGAVYHILVLGRQGRKIVMRAGLAWATEQGYIQTNKNKKTREKAARGW